MLQPGPGMETETSPHRRNQWFLRLAFLALFLLPLTFLGQLVDHFEAHFSGRIVDTIISSQWHIVVLNIVIFLTFLIPLSFRRKINWKEYGLVTAFFVSLFVEMYGLPLIMIFFSGYFDEGGGQKLPDPMLKFTLFGVDFTMTSTMVYGLVLMTVGTVLIILGWVTLYRNLKDDEIVTKGIYSYSRHPQYLGFLLVIIGWVVGWPTILTLIFGIILVLKYVQVCRVEEREFSHDENYLAYMKTVPFFF